MYSQVSRYRVVFGLNYKRMWRRGCKSGDEKGVAALTRDEKKLTTSFMYAVETSLHASGSQSSNIRL
jgi:hypothetical protein